MSGESALREAIARALFDQVLDARCDRDTLTDAILALPELQALRRARDQVAILSSVEDELRRRIGELIGLGVPWRGEPYDPQALRRDAEIVRWVREHDGRAWTDAESVIAYRHAALAAGDAKPGWKLITSAGTFDYDTETWTAAGDAKPGDG